MKISKPACLLLSLLCYQQISTAANGDYAVFAANDLGMHCADLDYKIFSILPPFNVIHGQVIQRGDGTSLPLLLDNSLVDLQYSATSSADDPVGSDSINTTSQNTPGVFKSNFWGRIPPTGAFTLGGVGYGPLYPDVTAGLLLDPPVDLTGSCFNPDTNDPALSTGCPSILTQFEPLELDTGLPVPDVEILQQGVLDVDQQSMPGIFNEAQPFQRFITQQPFFTQFSFGQTVPDANWWAVEGLPILPVDDAGRQNSYPLMKISAIDKATSNQLASLDIVVPVASEADCYNCHADVGDAGNGSASNFASTAFSVVTAAEAPGPQRLENASKINILRLHDAKHGSEYKRWSALGSLVDASCDTAINPQSDACLAKIRKVQCSRCHYSPALDLAQAGPVDEPSHFRFGRQQTRHVSMSRAMHGHHGDLPAFMGKPLFPRMPPPDSPVRTANQQVMPINRFEERILDKTCYQCHPGKQTQCLRGAMFSGGMVCQDCHGNMAEVGNDFSLKVSPENQGDFVLDGSLRVPWASEPGCQSCHTGDAANKNHPANAIVAEDGIRLMQAYTPTAIQVEGVPTPVRIALMNSAPDSPFAENTGINSEGDEVPTLFRLSTGHGGVKCQNCHGSTHAIWPNINPFANDNVAPTQIQGHRGTIVECSACHGENSFNIESDFRDNLDANGRMKGPHGMHPVNDPAWTHEHKEVDKPNRNSCRACHGLNGQGSVLSRTAADRVFECKETDLPGCNETPQGNVIAMPEGTVVDCVQCHENGINKRSPEQQSYLLSEIHSKDSFNQEQ